MPYKARTVILLATLLLQPTSLMLVKGQSLATGHLHSERPSCCQLIWFRPQTGHDINPPFLSKEDIEVFASFHKLGATEWSPDAQTLQLASSAQGSALKSTSTGYYLCGLNGGDLVYQLQPLGVSGLRYTLNFACFRIHLAKREELSFPATVWSHDLVGLRVPGTNNMAIREVNVDVPVKGLKAIALVRASEEHISQFELIKYSYPGVAQPVRPPENEETAAKRGAVRIGDPMDLATKRLADVPPGALAHPPEGSSWSSFWVYGDGLLAIEVDPETKLIRKLAYVLGAAGESPIFLPLNRIHLTDGEMFMPIPPPPSGNTRTPEGKPTVRPPEAAPPIPKP